MAEVPLRDAPSILGAANGVIGNGRRCRARARRSSDAIGAEVWIKRDDAGSLPLAGNKVRKLEHLIAAADRDDVQRVAIERPDEPRGG